MVISGLHGRHPVVRIFSVLASKRMVLNLGLFGSNLSKTITEERLAFCEGFELGQSFSDIRYVDTRISQADVKIPLTI